MFKSQQQTQGGFKISKRYVPKRGAAAAAPAKDEFGLSAEDYLLFDLPGGKSEGVAAQKPVVRRQGHCIRPASGVSECDMY